MRPTTGIRLSWSELSNFLYQHLTEHVLPFWFPKLIDQRYGGLKNCVQDDGEVLSTEKYLWSQGRALWVLSKLFNDIDQDSKWLEMATPIFKFLTDYGRNTDREWHFSLNEDGTPAREPQSIYVDGFCIYGLTEYAKATGHAKSLGIALEAYTVASPKLDDHRLVRTMPHPIPKGYQSHGPLMLFAHVFHELGILSGREDIQQRALELADRILTQHLDPKSGQLHEFVVPGGQKDSSDIGQTSIPGHVVESMWFLEEIYRYHGQSEKIPLLLETIRIHLELGWDQQFGGLVLATHLGGGKPQWHNPLGKIWWPHTESLQALLMTYAHNREKWAEDWYWKVHDYSFTHFPNWDSGDWFHNLDLEGKPTIPYLQTLPVKDPFHLPRSLIYSIKILDQLGETA
ncbi:MAG: AGE family epimerase/isomerase [SAR324 cluster bacterium]|nr:AGE family epimerase/isomerase [SAR324 cluster bacterium]